MIHFMYPKYLWLIIPAIFILFFLISKNFIRLKEKERLTEGYKQRRRKLRVLVFASRVLIVLLLIFALASPFQENITKTQGTPTVKVLIDNSTSMSIFKYDTAPLLDALKKETKLELRTIAEDETSPLGDAILQEMEMGKNLLLITDGQATRGIELTDVASYATSLNVTISAIDLSTSINDAGIEVIGPSKTVAGVENTFRIKINALSQKDFYVTVLLDGKPVIDTHTTDTSLEFTQRLTEGEHTIEALLHGQDYFPINNKFFKTVTVTERPKVLYITQKNDPVELIFSTLYRIDKESVMQSKLDDYYAIIINDMPEQSIGNNDALFDYLVEGNGLFVIGGMNSFDRGAYKNKFIEQVLPVYVGAAEKKKGNVNLVLAIDISGSTAEYFKNGSMNIKGDIEKALALTMLKSSIGKSNNIGVLAFNSNAFKVQDVVPLSSNYETIIDKISRLNSFGGTALHKALLGSYEMLLKKGGSKNIILISDGKGTVRNDYPLTIEAAKKVAKENIKIYTVGVGADTNEAMMKQIAEIGNGIYIKPDELQKIGLVFGDMEEEQQTSGIFGLTILDPNHFITKQLQLDAKVHAYNQVIPKATSKLLVVTDNGQPALTVWNFGLGRVASLNAFDTNGLGMLLDQKNSKLISRTSNWIVGDPERKKPYYVSIADGWLKDPMEIVVKAETLPETTLDFIKKEKDTYSAVFMPSNIGFGKIMEKQYAVNYPKEYRSLGMSKDLENLVQMTGGKLFKIDQTKDILDFLRSVSQRKKIEQKFYRWPLLFAAMLLLLFEIVMRKVFEWND